MNSKRLTIWGYHSHHELVRTHLNDRPSVNSKSIPPLHMESTAVAARRESRFLDKYLSERTDILVTNLVGDLLEAVLTRFNHSVQWSSPKDAGMSEEDIKALPLNPDKAPPEEKDLALLLFVMKGIKP